MRPRVFPAEDALSPHPLSFACRRFNEAAGIPRGRPCRRASSPPCVVLASMRPRVFPAEDPHGAAHDEPASDASMRPRVFPAEDWRAPAVSRRSPCGFNEAAGIPRGRRRAVAAANGARDASMRPRVFPAEDYRHRLEGPAGVRFNEAAGIPRGRRGGIPVHAAVGHRLQ